MVVIEPNGPSDSDGSDDPSDSDGSDDPGDSGGSGGAAAGVIVTLILVTAVGVTLAVVYILWKRR